MFITRLCQQLDKAKIPYAIVGGYAVALHGAPRGTADVDLVIRWNRKNLQAVEAALNEMGLVSKLPVTATEILNFRKEYIENRNMIAWNFYHPSNQAEQVDVLINYDLGKKAVNKVSVGSVDIKILNVKDLMAMKRDSGREQDLSDIDALQRLPK